MRYSFDELLGMLVIMNIKKNHHSIKKMNYYGKIYTMIMVPALHLVNIDILIYL